MKMENENNLNPAESLALINSMINKARQGYVDNSFYYLLWGWLVIVASAAHYIFDRFEIIEEPSMAWGLMFLGAFASFFYGRKQGKSAKVSHYSDKLYAWLWLSLGIGMVIIVINGQFVNYQIVPLILMLAGVGTFVSGVMIRFKTLQFGAVCLWAMSIFAFQLNEVEQLLAMSVGIALGYLLRGYLMKAKNRK